MKGGMLNPTNDKPLMKMTVDENDDDMADLIMRTFVMNQLSNTNTE